MGLTPSHQARLLPGQDHPTYRAVKTPNIRSGTPHADRGTHQIAVQNGGSARVLPDLLYHSA
jgi:hypothetical protein